MKCLAWLRSYLLVGGEWSYKECYCVENGSSLYYVVYLEGVK